MILNCIFIFKTYFKLHCDVSLTFTFLIFKNGYTALNLKTQQFLSSALLMPGAPRHSKRPPLRASRRRVTRLFQLRTPVSGSAPLRAALRLRPSASLSFSPRKPRFAGPPAAFPPASPSPVPAHPLSPSLSFRMRFGGNPAQGCSASSSLPLHARPFRVCRARPNSLSRM